MATSETAMIILKPSAPENIYDTLEIEDLDFEEDTMTFYYPCPCGDRFAITLVSVLILR